MPIRWRGPSGIRLPTLSAGAHPGTHRHRPLERRQRRCSELHVGAGIALRAVVISRLLHRSLSDVGLSFLQKLCFNDGATQRIKTEGGHRTVSAWFYRLLIEALLRGVRAEVVTMVKDTDACIDIGCGTGAMTIALRARARRVIGVDLSIERVAMAQTRLRTAEQSTIAFHVADATRLTEYVDKQFDCATIALLLHSVPHDVAIAILHEAQRIARALIIVEFVTPQPRTLSGFLAWALEYTAGREHFGAFRAYQKNGGVDALLCEAECTVRSRTIRPGKTLEIIAAEVR